MNFESTYFLLTPRVVVADLPLDPNIFTDIINITKIILNYICTIHLELRRNHTLYLTYITCKYNNDRKLLHTFIVSEKYCSIPYSNLILLTVAGIRKNQNNKRPHSLRINKSNAFRRYCCDRC